MNCTNWYEEQDFINGLLSTFRIWRFEGVGILHCKFQHFIVPNESNSFIWIPNNILTASYCSLKKKNYLNCSSLAD